MGFHDSASVADVVRGWHRGRTRATRTKRAREILTELMPILLATLAHTVNPDAAFMRFNDFLTRLPTGIQIFSLFHANPALLELVGQIMGSAPRLAGYFAISRSMRLRAVSEITIPGRPSATRREDPRQGGW